MQIPNPLRMTGRRILVTGASSGIGFASSVLLDNLGAHLVLVARDLCRLESARETLPGRNHAIEALDLDRCDDIASWMEHIAEKHGLLDGIVCSAGAYLLSPLRVLTDGQASGIWRLNVFASLALATAFRRVRGTSSDASIVFVSSVAGISGQAGLSVYSGAKSAILDMTRSLATELARERIRVNSVVPGNLRTIMSNATGPFMGTVDLCQMEKEYPCGFGDPRDVAHAIVFLLSPAARWMTGNSVIVDGGFSAH